MGCLTPIVPPTPIEPPLECPEIPSTYQNIWMENSATDRCLEVPCYVACNFFPGLLVWAHYGCEFCAYAVYMLSSCDCYFDPIFGGGTIFYTCNYVFVGCSYNDGVLPGDYPCEEAADEAYILANTYGFNPPRKRGPARLRIVDTGKFEPDHNYAGETRTMVLASWVDKTNILIKYVPAELDI